MICVSNVKKKDKMNNKRIKKVKKILKKQFTDILKQTYGLNFFQRLHICYQIIFKVKIKEVQIISPK